MLFVAFITTLLFASVSHAAPSTNKTLTFQGRLLTPAGAVVPDGHYNIQFKIYQDGSGNVEDNTDGTLKWTESHVNNGGTSGVEVKNGFFSASLGSITPFGSSVDWNQDTLWLSMNVAGSSAACTTFGDGGCTPDGEMLPMKRLTATPYAINAGQLGGRDASGYLQNTTVPQTANLAITSADAGSVVANIQGTAGQTANLLEVGASGAGTPVMSVGATGSVAIQNTVDSTTALSVNNAAGDRVFAVNTAENSVSVGDLSLSSASTTGTPTSLWSNSTTVSSPTYNDGGPITIGTIFKSTSTGNISGIKFYNTPSTNTGGDIGKLWSCASPTCSASGGGGTEIASVNFPATSVAGWQTVNFASPVAIDANRYYIISRYSATGNYVATSGYFSVPLSNGALVAPASGGGISNGIFAASSTPTFPTSSFNNANYWVDVTFQSSAKAEQITTNNTLGISSTGLTLNAGSGALDIQGNAVNISASTGGSVTIQGGTRATPGNGGDVIIEGGQGNGTVSSSGLVVINMPAFKTKTDDDNCLHGEILAASSCTLNARTVNEWTAAMVGFSAPGQTVTVPNPVNTTAGRIFYITGLSSSEDFMLKINSGQGAGVEQLIPMSKATTVQLFWSGFGYWTVVSGLGGGNGLQSAYNSSAQNTGSADVTLSGANGSGALMVHDSATSPVASTLLGVTSASGSNLFSVNSNVTNGAAYASDGSVDDGANFATNWPSAGSATVSRITTDGQNGSSSAQVVAGTAAGNGIANTLASAPATNSQFRVSAFAKLVAGSALTDFTIRYSPDGGSTSIDCTNYSTQTITNNWTAVTCDIATGSASATNPQLYFVQPSTATSARTFLIDNLSFTLASNAIANVKVGNGGDAATLFTLDKAASAPTSSDNADLLGSMYYDSTLGKVQCYEAEGWGACADSPDTFVTISPEYSGAVMNGTDIGTISSDLCSDTLNINDGSSSQPTICGTDETYNFYKWTSAESSAQTRSIFVTYRLPGSFKQFVAGSTSLHARTDSTNSSVTYQLYRDNGSGLTACGSTVAVSSGSQTSWQEGVASGGNDPSGCNFAAGDSILVRINLTASQNANAYVSNLGFTFNNN